jgi:glycosyltransferase involved in cell wall biosynthesis
MDYLIAVQAPCRPLSDGRFATESAFAEHLRDLRHELGPRFDRVLLAAPTDGGDPDGVPSHLAIIDPRTEGIDYLPLHPHTCGTREFWLRQVPALWPKVYAAARRSGVVHAGLADDIRRPAMALVDLAGLVARRPVVFVVDIDFRRDAWMFWKSGLWSFRTYVLNRIVQDSFKMAQVHLARRTCALVLLKSGKMVDEVGRGASHVRNFHDSVLKAEHILDDEAIEARAQAMAASESPLQLVCFCRLVPYKGVERAVRAVHRVRQRGLPPVRLRIIGEGEERPALERLIATLGVGDQVSLEAPVPYGPALFDRIDACDAMIATPLVEDSPRAAFDAMARGLPILAFDIQYYVDLERESGAVRTAAWPQVDSLADGMAALAADREGLARMARRAVVFARQNTQAIWLKRRVRWTLEAMVRHGSWEPRRLSGATGGAVRGPASAGRRAGRPPGIDGQAVPAPGPGGGSTRGRRAASTAEPEGPAPRGS